MAGFTTTALLLLTAAKTGSDFIGQRSQASAIEKQGDFESMLYGRNADQAERQAKDAVARGEETAYGITRGAEQLRGAQRAALAASGVDIDSGSAADVQSSDLTLSALDAKRVRLNAAREAAGYTTEAETDRMMGDFARRSGKTAARAIRNQSVVTLLSGVGQLANVYQSAPKGFGRTPLPSPDYGASTYGSGGMFGAVRQTGLPRYGG